MAKKKKHLRTRKRVKSSFVNLGICSTAFGKNVSSDWNFAALSFLVLQASEILTQFFFRFFLYSRSPSRNFDSICNARENISGNKPTAALLSSRSRFFSRRCVPSHRLDKTLFNILPVSPRALYDHENPWSAAHYRLEKKGLENTSERGSNLRSWCKPGNKRSTHTQDIWPPISAYYTTINLALEKNYFLSSHRTIFRYFSMLHIHKFLFISHQIFNKNLNIL